MRLNAYQTPKTLRELNIMREDFTALENYQLSLQFIISELNGRNIRFMLQSNLPGKCVCMYLISPHSSFPLGVALCSNKS